MTVTSYRQGGGTILLLWLLWAVPVAADEQEDFGRGAQSWAENCARCHAMRDPHEFRDDLWKAIVLHMRVRAGITGQQSRDILRFLQDSNAPLGGAGTRAEAASTADGADGKLVYEGVCISCHGVDGRGALPGVPDFTARGGPLGKSDDELRENIVRGFQSPGSPMAMPARGGNPRLSDADLMAVLGYIRQSFGR